MLRVADIFSDGMVLQQEKAVCVWGTATDTQSVTLYFMDEIYTASVCDDKWKIYLKPCKSEVPLTMRIFTSNEEIVIRDILLGEVFLASGQSNMTFCNLWEANWEAEQLICENDKLRVFSVPKISHTDGAKVDGKWQKTKADTAKDFSAVAYYAAKKLYESLQVPIGIISCEWGGTGIKTWMDESYLLRDEELKVHYDSYVELMDSLDLKDYDTIFSEYEHTAAAVENLLYDPETVKKLGLYQFMKCPLHGLFPKTPEGPKMQNRPGGLYHTMVETVTPYTIRSVIWYQGEGNTSAKDIIGYKKMILALMENWRDVFENPELFFCIVQLSAFGIGEPLEDPSWPIVREIQRTLCNETPNTSLVVSADFGEMDNIHPVHKKVVGERCGESLLHHLYGKEPSYEVIQPTKVCRTAQGIEVCFDRNLIVKYVPTLFKIYDENGASEVVSPYYYGDKIVFENFEMEHPTKLSYGWINGVKLGLYDEKANPVIPFMEVIS